MKLLAAFVVTLVPAFALAQDSPPPPYAGAPPGAEQAPPAAQPAYPPPAQYPPPTQYPPAGAQPGEPPPYAGAPPEAGPPPGPQQPPPDPYAGQQDPYAGQPAEAPVDPNTPQYGYVGPHPVPYDVGGAYCTIEGPHFHEYAPFDQYLFRQAGGYFYFIGDPADFGYQGQMWGYSGNHPIPMEDGGGYCYINWPHRHAYAPPAALMFRLVGGYYNYYGAWDPMYWANRAAWLGYWGGYYHTSYFGGRYYTMRPRPIYRGNYGWGHPGVYRPGVTVVGPHGGSIVVGRGRPGGGVYGSPGRPVYGTTPVRPGGYVAPRPAYVAPNAGHPVYGAPGRVEPRPNAGVPVRPVVEQARPAAGGAPRTNSGGSVASHPAAGPHKRH